ncbi:LysM peptidoglycan-binding domain-containing protein [Pseudarthrobacter psychrotolerans]|uniref:LysM peptidoglycan-binding domain-containing protein n=1 Tax=Pseudarthrobacter psychrotolerans TaxID=2697569 RepID=A0A6P1NI64_9MICC|nr:LysM domain-containing protein [Pseudarthrobacter psychrotolerans]QHK20026.1 LysM peptidoglycan-binding domain-containing protein [Pseudarthrobacter psychrotolerans]
MYQLTAKTSEPPRRNFETDVPRVELIPGRRPISNKLWAGMATAAVISAFGVGALAGPAPTAELSAPPDAITTAASPVVRVARPLAAVPLDAPYVGSVEFGSAGAGAQPEVAAAVPPSAPAEAAPPPAPELAPAPAGDSNVYTVVPGDTVGGIAARYGVNTNAMLAANGLGLYSIIVPGQTLKLTGPAVEVSAPAPAPAPVAYSPAFVPEPAPVQAAPAVRTIYVAGAGGQAMVDACIGPIHFTPNDGYSLFITEHDFCGGWARFSGIGVGETVSIPGYGTYTATARGQVPNPGTTNDVVAVFGGFPRAVLQTCIPGTNQMLLIALN